MASILPFRLLPILLTATLLLTPCARAGLSEDIPASLGHSAQELCTRVLHGGDDYWRVRNNYVVPIIQLLPVAWDVGAPSDTRMDARAGSGGAGQRFAIHRPGLGCTVVRSPEEERQVLAQQSRYRLISPLPAYANPWPLGENAADPVYLTEIQRGLIERHAASLFAEPWTDPARKRNTTALVVAKDGHLVYERYAFGYQRNQPQPGWGMTASLTALLAGIAASDSLLSLDAPVNLTQWAGTPKADIRWRQLLNMASGLAWTEGFDGGTDTTELLYSRHDGAGWAADHAQVSAPGAAFTYSTGTPAIAMLALRELLGGSAPELYTYYQRNLFAPLGIRHGVIEPDASGTPQGGARGVLRPVDWLRLGQLVANDGLWDGRRLIPKAFMDFLRAPSPANPGYGGGVWRQPSELIPEAMRARLPADLLWFAGYQGQLTVIVPSRNLVLVRMGAALEEDSVREQVFGLVAELVAQS